jgi:phosphate:Na+ symporter
MEIFLMVLGGLGLFLFAINNLSETLKELIGDKANKWLDLFTKNVVTSVITGIVATILLDSSSAVIIMTIVLVNAGALTFRQSLGIVMGANIGTTFSSQLIALDIGQYSPIPIFLGLVFSFFAKSEKLLRRAGLCFSLAFCFSDFIRWNGLLSH